MITSGNSLFPNKVTFTGMRSLDINLSFLWGRIYVSADQEKVDARDVNHYKHIVSGTSLVIQWLRIHLPGQGTRHILGQGTVIPHALEH